MINSDLKKAGWDKNFETYFMIQDLMEHTKRFEREEGVKIGDGELKELFKHQIEIWGENVHKFTIESGFAEMLCVKVLYQELERRRCLPYDCFMVELERSVVLGDFKLVGFLFLENIGHDGREIHAILDVGMESKLLKLGILMDENWNIIKCPNKYLEKSKIILRFFDAFIGEIGDSSVIIRNVYKISIGGNLRRLNRGSEIKVSKNEIILTGQSYRYVNYIESLGKWREILKKCWVRGHVRKFKNKKRYRCIYDLSSKERTKRGYYYEYAKDMYLRMQVRAFVRGSEGVLMRGGYRVK